MTSVSRLLCLWLILLGSFARGETGASPAQVLDSFHQAAARADAKAYFSAMTEEVVFLGTDGSERWQGQDFRNFVRGHFDMGRGWAYEAVERNIELSNDGRFAWFDESLLNHDLGKCRGSGVLVKADGNWRIAQYNLSVPIPNAIVLEVVTDIAALDAEVGGQSAVEQVGQGKTSAETSDPTAEAEARDSAAGDGARDCRKKRFKTNRRAGC